MPAYGSDSLATISTDGVVPSTRFKDAGAVQDFVRRLCDNDNTRSFKRSRVNGLVDGNPPYKASLLKQAGRADAANVNWGIARAYLESGKGAFYDLFSESPSFLYVPCEHGTPEQRQSYTSILSQEADGVLRRSKVWDYTVQLSQENMVLHGCGPLLFEDSKKVIPRAYNCGDLKVPEFTQSDTHYWEVFMVQGIFYPGELYKSIENEEAASKVGWNVEYTKQVIANAMDIRTNTGIQYDWEFYQQELKNNANSYMYDDSKVCRLAYVFWKEFDGTITHAIVERDTTTGGGNTTKTGEESGQVQYLYFRQDRYKSFQQCIHPMYYDHGNGGYHHSVTGLGVKMFSAMEYQNRLICNLADKAFSPKIIFSPTSTEAATKFELVRLGEFAVTPKGFELNQTGIAGLMNDGIAMNSLLTDVVASNLAAYRPQPMKQEGNPVTSRQVQYDASVNSSMSKTQFNRYYEQLDQLYAEIYRRLSDLNNDDPMAVEFQQRCLDRKVPKEAIAKVGQVRAVRVVGQGSAFMRKQALDSIWIKLGQALPEDGRDNLITDSIAAEAGYAAADRYYPKRTASQMSNDQEAEAMQWVAAMKTGVPPLITPTQNAVVYATTFLKAGMQALQSVQQGANPMEVVKFLEIDGPAVMAHLRRFGQDPTRQALLKQMITAWKELSRGSDQLKKQIQQMQQQQAQQRQRTQQVMSDEQLKQAKVSNDIQLKTVKTRAQLQQSAEKHRQKMMQAGQDMQLKDIQTAAELHTNRLKAFQEP